MDTIAEGGALLPTPFAKTGSKTGAQHHTDRLFFNQINRFRPRQPEDVSNKTAQKQG